MNRKDFGQLLAALRLDLGWTQFQLAEAAELDVAVVSQIERGVKRNFEPELLFQLANALQLTTIERREFVLAASGLDESQLVRQPVAGMATDTHDVNRMLERLVKMTGELAVPAYLYDAYGDVVAANAIMLAFYNAPPSMLETAANIPGGYSVIRLNFNREMAVRAHVLENWEQYAVNSMRAFRECSLRYRATPYFKYLMKAFRNRAEYPYFDRFWKAVSSLEEDKEGNVDYFSYRHSELGSLNYIASSTVYTTSHGELFLIYYIPTDDQTYKVFDQLRQKAGRGAVRLAPWPEKPMP